MREIYTNVNGANLGRAQELAMKAERLSYSKEPMEKAFLSEVSDILGRYDRLLRTLGNSSMVHLSAEASKDFMLAGIEREEEVLRIDELLAFMEDKN